MIDIKIVLNTTGHPTGKLADAELHFIEGPLHGLKLVGFGIWHRESTALLHVTFLARAYAVNGERRSVHLVRCTNGSKARQALIDMIVQAYTGRPGRTMSPAKVAIRAPSQTTKYHHLVAFFLRHCS